jgi:hypothetical protein
LQGRGAKTDTECSHGSMCLKSEMMGDRIELQSQ